MGPKEEQEMSQALRAAERLRQLREEGNSANRQPVAASSQPLPRPPSQSQAASSNDRNPRPQQQSGQRLSSPSQGVPSSILPTAATSSQPPITPPSPLRTYARRSSPGNQIRTPIIERLRGSQFATGSQPSPRPGVSMHNPRIFLSAMSSPTPAILRLARAPLPQQAPVWNLNNAVVRLITMTTAAPASPTATSSTSTVSSISTTPTPTTSATQDNQNAPRRIKRKSGNTDGVEKKKGKKKKAEASSTVTSASATSTSASATATSSSTTSIRPAGTSGNAEIRATTSSGDPSASIVPSSSNPTSTPVTARPSSTTVQPTRQIKRENEIKIENEPEQMEIENNSVQAQEDADGSAQADSPPQQVMMEETRPANDVLPETVPDGQQASENNNASAAVAVVVEPDAAGPSSQNSSTSTQPFELPPLPPGRTRRKKHPVKPEEAQTTKKCNSKDLEENARTIFNYFQIVRDALKQSGVCTSIEDHRPLMAVENMILKLFANAQQNQTVMQQGQESDETDEEETINSNNIYSNLPGTSTQPSNNIGPVTPTGHTNQTSEVEPPPPVTPTTTVNSVTVQTPHATASPLIPQPFFVPAERLRSNVDEAIDSMLNRLRQGSEGEPLIRIRPARDLFEDLDYNEPNEIQMPDPVPETGDYEAVFNQIVSMGFGNVSERRIRQILRLVHGDIGLCIDQLLDG